MPRRRSSPAGLEVRENSGRVAPHPRDAWPLERRLAEAPVERVSVAVEALSELRFCHLGANTPFRVRRGARELHVPRAHILTDVAPEQPVAHERALACGELPAALDRQVGDAAAGIEDMRRHERGGGARVETGSAAAAAIRLEGEVGVEQSVGEDDTDERKRADLGVNEHGVLADPAESRSLRELPL